MKSIKFTVPGNPFGKQRPKFARMGTYTKTYTPKKTTQHEKEVAECFLEVARGRRFKEKEPLDIRIIAYYPIPQSTSKKRRKEMLEHRIRPTVKPDLDNVAKLIYDALNGVAWYDDNGGGTGNSTSGGTQTKQMYRVRKTWADAASQKGAFTSLENAKKCADENKGYSVFDSNGNKVYPASANTGTSCNYVVKITVDGLRYRDNPGTSGTKVLGYLKKNYKYTVVEERTVNGVKWGKLKSGAGWFSLQSEYSVRC